MLKKIKKLMKNRGVLICIGVALLMIIILLVIIFNFDNMLGVSDEKVFKEEYENLNGQVDEYGREYIKVQIKANNGVEYSNLDEIISIFKDKKDAVIYFGYPTCSYCRSAVQVLFDVVAETKLDKIYYLDTEELGISYEKLIDVVGNSIELDENGNKELDVPLVLFVTNGSISSYNKGTLFSHTTPFKELNKSQVDGLSEIYRSGIKDVLANMD